MIASPAAKALNAALMEERRFYRTPPVTPRTPGRG